MGMDNDDIANAEWHEAFADVLATCGYCGGYQNDHTQECGDRQEADSR